jgi:DUF2075 family protein
LPKSTHTFARTLWSGSSITPSVRAPISLQGIKRLAEAADPLADELIKNTYRTLMTRGVQGCYLYVCDPQLEAYLRRRIARMQLQG